MKKALSISIFLALLVPSVTFAAQNAGLVSGVWFSQTNIVENVPVDVSVVVQNETNETLKGTVLFSTAGVEIGTDSVSIPAGGIVRASITHSFGAGNTTVTTTFEAEGETELNGARLPARTVSVDLDTDGDKIGNEEDTDDDNDGIADVDDDEPLVKYVPPQETEGTLSQIAEKTGIASSTSAILEKLLGTSEGEQSTSTIAKVTRGAFGSVVNTTLGIENVRAQTADNLQEYHEEQRQTLDAIERASVDGFQVSVEDESVDPEGKTQAQVAAVGAAILGSIFEHQALFYAHIVILFLSFWHFLWRYFQRKYRAQY